MKITFSIFILLFAYSVASAQTSGQPGKDVVVRVCAPGKGSLLNQKPLFVVFLKGKQVFVADTALKAINPDDINSISVLKDSISTKSYGPAGRNGVVEIYLKDEKFPNGFIPAAKPGN
jgi:hypothetical protein